MENSKDRVSTMGLKYPQQQSNVSCLVGYSVTSTGAPGWLLLLNGEEMAHAEELMFVTCFVSNSLKGPTKSYAEQQSLGYTSYCGGARSQWKFTLEFP